VLYRRGLWTQRGWQFERGDFGGGPRVTAAVEERSPGISQETGGAGWEKAVENGRRKHSEDKSTGMSGPRVKMRKPGRGGARTSGYEGLHKAIEVSKRDRDTGGKSRQANDLCTNSMGFEPRPCQEPFMHEKKAKKTRPNPR